MRWFRIPKELTPIPTAKRYWEWKACLAKEARNQCVYCTIHVQPFGGIRNFHVEHYKPKSLSQFKDLEHDFKNTYFACSICNCFKGNDWPNEPNDNFDITCYPDPSKVDYSILFMTEKDFKLSSKIMTGKYLIEKLFLNRPQLILERRTFHLVTSLKQELLKLKASLEEYQTKKENDLLTSYLKTVRAAITLAEQRFVIPYEEEDIEK